MSSFPVLVRSVSPSGEARFALGDPLVDSYLEFVAGRCRANTLPAVTLDLKLFFTIVVKDPVTRVRRRAAHNLTARAAISHARNQVLSAIRFLDWLAAHALTLDSCTQSDLDLWLATGPRSRYDVRHFVEWTSPRKLTTNFHVPP